MLSFRELVLWTQVPAEELEMGEMLARNLWLRARCPGDS